MPDHGYPVLFVLFLWWFSTGAILYLDGLPQRTYRWTMLGSTVVLGAGCWALWAARNDLSATGAYLAFCGALAVWGWNEVAFLSGWVTGPRQTPCPWAMRLCAKLNIFLGVPNAPVSFLPAHLAHLASYFRVRPMNPLFPLTITAATAFCGVLLALATTATSEGAAVGLTILTTLMALGILEQWLLILPLPAESLWKWGMRSRALPTAIIEVPLPGVVLSSFRDANHKGSEQ